MEGRHASERPVLAVPKPWCGQTPTCPGPWVSPRRSHLIQLSVCGALNRHRTGRARRKWSLCSRDSLFHLRKKSAQNLVPAHLGTTHHGSGVGQRESGPGTRACHLAHLLTPLSPTPLFQSYFLCRNKCLASLLYLAGSDTSSNTQLKQHLRCEALPAHPVGLTAPS